MSSSPKPPKPTDPRVAAQAQAEFNRYGTQTPFGSTRWEGEGANARQIAEYSPELMELFGAARQQAMKPRQEYAPPEAFAGMRDALSSRINDRNSMGRPVYQPTQTYGGTLGIGGGPSPVQGGQPQQEISTAPNIQMEFGGNQQQKPVIPGDMNPLTKPMGDPGNQIQPVDPDGKSLRGNLGAMLGGQQTETPWRDAFLGPADANGERSPFRNMLRGGLAGALGRGIGNSLVSGANDEGRPMGRLPPGAASNQPGQLGAMFNATQGVGSGGGIDRTLARIAEQANQNMAGPLKPNQKPKPSKPRGGLFKPAGSTSRGRAMASLGIGNQIWGAGQDNRALEALGIHTRGIPEEQ